MKPLHPRNQITVAVCCFNAAHYLPDLLEKLISQNCTIPFEVLIVDNNSTDNTELLIADCVAKSELSIRYVKEHQQGIAYARNRAIEESLSSQYLAFIDADELPKESWLQTAVSTLSNQDVDCVGGKISVLLPYRPSWLSDDLLPFYGEVNHSMTSFRITDRSTPIWTGNIAYNTRIFQQGLRFDSRYNRKGKGVGGGEDVIMFNYFLQNNLNIIYNPDMEILHLIPDEKVNRRYFLKLHFIAGKNSGLYEIDIDSKKICRVPMFMFAQLITKFFQILNTRLTSPNKYMREAMNFTHLLGMILGQYKK